LREWYSIHGSRSLIVSGKRTIKCSKRGSRGNDSRLGEAFYQLLKKLNNEVVEKRKGIIFAASNPENGEVAQLVRAHDS
jgi:hypothetical protein